MAKKLWHEIVNEEEVRKKVDAFVKDLLNSNFALDRLSVTFSNKGGQTRFNTTVDGNPAVLKAAAEPDPKNPTVH